MAGAAMGARQPGTALPHYETFDAVASFRKMEFLCTRYGLKPETIRKVVLEPVLRDGEVVSFRGDGPLFAYACSKSAAEIGMLANSVIAEGGISGNEAHQAKQDLWAILRDFSMGYSPVAEEKLGLVSRTRLRAWLNLQAVNALYTGGLTWDLSAMLAQPQISSAAKSLLGEVKDAGFRIAPAEQGEGTFKVAFSVSLRGQAAQMREDGAVLWSFPVHSRTLLSPALKPDMPYVVSTAAAESVLSIADILPDFMRGMRRDFIVMHKENTLIVADVTGSFG
ncbi:MAG: hypothetical protein AB1529_03870 [Candidatus Micrarchaeota archaeon]